MTNLPRGVLMSIVVGRAEDEVSIAENGKFNPADIERPYADYIGSKVNLEAPRLPSKSHDALVVTTRFGNAHVGDKGLYGAMSIDLEIQKKKIYELLKEQAREGEIDLEKTYVEAGTPECEMFLDECERQGIEWISGRKAKSTKVKWKQFIGVVVGPNITTDQKDAYYLNKGYKKLTVADLKGEDKMYEYELIKATPEEIAKRMIDGETTYDTCGRSSYGWNGTSIVRLEDGKRIGVFGDFYERMEAKEPEWFEKLDGTVENSVLCVVGDRVDSDQIVAIVRDYSWHTSRPFIAATAAWIYATPLTKKEIQKLMDNAPE